LSLAASEVIPAWQAVERLQRAQAPAYRLVTQPDHALLAGALAALFVAPGFPALDPLVVRAIEVHDAGWSLLDPEADPSAPPALDDAGKPLSFIEVSPPDFLRAWGASIDTAEHVCAAGGIIVSAHFRRLSHHRLNAAKDSAEHVALLHQFDERETLRQQRLRPLTSVTDRDLASFLEALQFCDLLSLYLCCGAEEEVEFPQDFAAGRVRLRHRDGRVELDPSPFQRGADASPQQVELSVPATRYDSSAGRSADSAMFFTLR
jgi:hypothetical protein